MGISVHRRKWYTHICRECSLLENHIHMSHLQGRCHTFNLKSFWFLAINILASTPFLLLVIVKEHLWNLTRFIVFQFSKGMQTLALKCRCDRGVEISRLVYLNWDCEKEDHVPATKYKHYVAPFKCTRKPLKSNLEQQQQQQKSLILVFYLVCQQMACVTVCCSLIWLIPYLTSGIHQWTSFTE